MKPMVLAGVLLIIGGVLALAYQGLSYTKEKKVLDLGPIEATTHTEETIPIPPVVGGVALLGGVILVAAGMKN